jgi:hypothetical protein
MGYLIKKQVQEIVTAKVTLTAADLLTPGFIVDIPEYPAVKDYYWQVLTMVGNIVNGSIPYTASSAIHIQSSSGTIAQYRFNGSYMAQNTGSWQFAVVLNPLTNNTQFVDNDKLQIHNPGTLLLGDNDLDIYITAILIKK